MLIITVELVPGQAVVFYQGDTVAGGGWISEVPQ